MAEEKETESQEAQTAAPSSLWGRRGSWMRQLTGALLGAFVGQVVASVAPRWGIAVSDPGALVLWGAAIGALLASLERFARAGSYLTGRKDKDSMFVNLLIALLGIALIFGLLLGALALIGSFFD